MKHIVIGSGTLIFFIWHTTAVFCQNKNSASLIAKADKYYQSAEYFMASHEYQKASQVDTGSIYVKAQLAECYRYLYDYKNAEPLYQKLAQLDPAKYPTARFWYASILKDNGEFSNAAANFERFRKDTETNTDFELELYKEKAKQEITNCNELAEEEKKETINTHKLRCMPSPVNSEASDFAPVIGVHDDELVVTSSKLHAHTKATSGQSDVHRFSKGADTSWQAQSHTHQDKFASLNTHFSESSGSFTTDFKKYYFTRCDEQIMLDKHMEFNCAIYVSTLDNNKWTTPKRLNDNINAPGQWNAQPSISPDGSLLFFVSKRPGGAGMHDVWFSTSNGDDQWTPPQNLYSINTMYMDVSPKFSATTNAIFFASNGHGGYGGLDIFMAKAEDGFSKLYHLKKPFNSNRDDFFFVLGARKGYLTSNRKGGLGNDDIYGFEMEAGPSEFIKEIMGQK